MFFKKDPVKKLQKQYMAKMEAARNEQRGGDVKKAAILTAEAEEIAQKIEALQAAKN